jgi:lipopolysaccharide transport system ATP-binding protein
MADFAIRAVGLSKQYRIGQLLRRHDTLRDQISSAAKALVHGDLKRTPPEMIWALEDVSFEIDQGEIVGIIGRNGAGKTTLLRLLSRISEPTAGYADVRGRLRSLLEVGTGFHGELTGRENIYLNGAILGRRRTEVNRKFDEIVEFSGVEKFLDTPLKRYSSGMYVRLAFAVAAHLEPEILIVDEVLAVGDAAFQKRCLGKMETIGRSGRTVVFVSHSMPTVTRLCSRAILLDGGHVVADGPTESIVARYLQADLGTTARREWPEPGSRPGDDVARLRSVTVVGADGQPVEAADLREPVGIELAFDVISQREPITPMIAVYNEQGVHAFNALDPDPRWERPQPPGRYRSCAWIPGNLLNEGSYIVSVFLNTVGHGKTVKHVAATEIVSFQVADLGAGPSAKGTFGQPWGGVISPLLEWTIDTEGVETIRERSHL